MADQFDYRMLAKGVTPIDLPNPIQNALGAQQVAGAQTANALNGIKLQNDQRAMGIQSELDNFDGTDPTKLSRPAQKQFATEQSAQKLAALDSHMKIIEAGTQLAQGATNQAEWDQFRQQMAQFDPKAAANIDPLFTPEKRDAFVVKGLSVKDSFANQMKMMELQSRDADRQEMMKYRRDMLGIAQQNANTKEKAATVPAGETDAETVDRIANFAIANGGSVPAGTYAFGKAGNPMRDAVNKRITEIQRGDNSSVDWSQKSRDVLQNRADVSAQRKASGDFASGAQGKMINANHTALSHIDALIGLQSGLNNGEMQTANQIKNYFSQKTGNGNVTSYKAARDVVGKEIMNAIVAGGGGIEERLQAQKNLSSDLSDEQFSANVAAYKDLMTARNNSLVQQGRSLGVNDKILNPFGSKSAAEQQQGGMRVPMSAIRQAAQSEGVSIEQAMQDAIDQGHSIYGD